MHTHWRDFWWARRGYPRPGKFPQVGGWGPHYSDYWGAVPYPTAVAHNAAAAAVQTIGAK